MSIDKKLLKRLKVLYVEDDDSIRNELGDLLEKFFDIVYTVADGEAGLEHFKQHQIDIDVILSDISMPKMNGIEMAKAIRKIDAKIPIIFATAYSDNDYLADAIKLRVNDYIVKPIDIRHLLTIMNDLANILYQEFLIEQQNKELERYKDVIDQNNIVIKTDINKNITYVNQQFCKITGYDCNELLGETFEHLKHKDTAIDIINEMFDTVFKNEAWIGKIKSQTKFDDFYVVDCYTIATLSDAGEIIGTISIQKDITAELNQKRQIQRALIKDKSEIFLKGKESSAELNTIINELNKRINDLQYLLSVSDLEKDKITQNYEKLITANQKLKIEFPKINKTNQDLSLKVKKLIENEKNLKGELTHTELQIEELEKQNQEYLDQIELFEDIAAIKQKLEHWKAKAKENGKRIGLLEQEILNIGDKEMMNRLFR